MEAQKLVQTFFTQEEIDVIWAMCNDETEHEPNTNEGSLDHVYRSIKIKIEPVERYTLCDHADCAIDNTHALDAE